MKLLDIVMPQPDHRPAPQIQLRLAQLLIHHDHRVHQLVIDQHLANSIYGLLMAQNITKLRKMNINYLITGVQGRMLDMGVPVFKDLFMELKTKEGK